MKKEKYNTHDSYGMLSISRFSGGGSEFFGSDIVQDGGISITISKASVSRKYSEEWFNTGDTVVRIDLSANQYVDAITSGMNTQGVPCTIKQISGQRINSIPYATDKKELFKSEMEETQQEFKKRIDDILLQLEGNIGKKKKDEIIFNLGILKSHISSNTNFVLDQFDEAMEKTVTEAKQSISNFIDNKVHSLGIEGMRDQLCVSIDNKGLSE